MALSAQGLIRLSSEAFSSGRLPITASVLLVIAGLDPAIHVVQARAAAKTCGIGVAPIWMLLAKFAEESGAGRDRIIVLSLDNAGWHTPKGLQVPQGLRLEYLPPYSPEGGPGKDTLVGKNGEDNTIYGDNSGTLSGASGGDDALTGGKNATNHIYGDADTLMGHAATGGNDTLTGGANSTNYLYGDANSVDGAPTGGNDTLIGGVGGTNYLIGDFQSASPGGPTGGNDRLVSAANSTDYMWGDFQSTATSPPATFGQDTFVFRPNNGNDYIYDFDPNYDIIEIGGFQTASVPENAATHVPPQAGHSPGSFDDLNITEEQVTDPITGSVATSSVIHFDAQNSVTVFGVTGLTTDDFAFV